MGASLPPQLRLPRLFSALISSAGLSTRDGRFRPWLLVALRRLSFEEWTLKAFTARLAVIRKSGPSKKDSRELKITTFPTRILTLLQLRACRNNTSGSFQIRC